MSTITSAPYFDRHRAVLARFATDRRQPGIFRRALGRIYDAIMLSRQRQVERDFARLLGQSGGRLTDETERRFAEHLTRNGNFRP